MVRVIDHAHLIGLGVADTQADLRYVLAHLPLHCGLRFSRNEVTPSRKSAVCRMAALSRTPCSIWESSCERMKPLINFLVSRTELGLFSIICAASSRARSISFSDSTISLTRP